MKARGSLKTIVALLGFWGSPISTFVVTFSIAEFAPTDCNVTLRTAVPPGNVSFRLVLTKFKILLKSSLKITYMIRGFHSSLRPHLTFQKTLAWRPAWAATG